MSNLSNKYPTLSFSLQLFQMIRIRALSLIVCYWRVGYREWEVKESVIELQSWLDSLASFNPNTLRVHFRIEDCHPFPSPILGPSRSYVGNVRLTYKVSFVSSKTKWNQKTRNVRKSLKVIRLRIWKFKNLRTSGLG